MIVALLYLWVCGNFCGFAIRYFIVLIQWLLFFGKKVLFGSEATSVSWIVWGTFGRA